jgi:putative hydrolase of the HAD superfamily
MAVSAVLFDFDDTLIDWPTAIDHAIGEGLAAAGLPADRLARNSLWEEIRAYTWVRRDGRVIDRAHWKLLFEPQVPWQRAFPFESKSAVAAGSQRFRELLEVPLFPDAAAALDQLRERYPVALLSNSPIAKHWATKLGILDRFSSITLADDPYRKPHPRAFHDACDAARVSPDGAIYVGDSFRNDIEGALDAGLRAVWVDRFGDGHPLPFGAWRVEKLSKLADVIESFA